MKPEREDRQTSDEMRSEADGGSSATSDPALYGAIANLRRGSCTRRVSSALQLRVSADTASFSRHRLSCFPDLDSAALPFFQSRVT